MARLHLMRHGETAWNAEKRYQGSQDIPLNERGRLQAEEASQLLSSFPFAAIYASNLSRAKQTAEIIKGSRDLSIKPLAALNEGSFGSLEGKTSQEMEEEYSLQIQKRSQLSKEEVFHFKLTPDQESWFEVLQRVVPTLETIANTHLGKDVLVVTHGGVIRTLLVYFANKEWSTLIHNGEIVTFLYENKQFIHN